VYERFSCETVKKKKMALQVGKSIAELNQMAELPSENYKNMHPKKYFPLQMFLSIVFMYF